MVVVDLLGNLVVVEVALKLKIQQSYNIWYGVIRSKQQTQAKLLTTFQLFSFRYPHSLGATMQAMLFLQVSTVLSLVFCKALVSIIELVRSYIYDIHMKNTIKVTSLVTIQVIVLSSFEQIEGKTVLN